MQLERLEGEASIGSWCLKILVGLVKWKIAITFNWPSSPVNDFQQWPTFLLQIVIL